MTAFRHHNWSQTRPHCCGDAPACRGERRRGRVPSHAPTCAFPWRLGTTGGPPRGRPESFGQSQPIWHDNSCLGACRGVKLFKQFNRQAVAIMSIFLDFSCSVPSKTKVLCVKWCAVERICAVATSDHSISFYLEEGLPVQCCKISRKVDATVIAWHPKTKAIATGWEDGHIAVWGLSSSGSQNMPGSTCIFAAVTKSVYAPIRIMTWNPSATRLLSGDATGMVIIWKVRLQCRGSRSNKTDQTGGCPR